MNRVKAILLANSGIGLIKRPAQKRARRITWRDGMRFAVAVTLGAVALFALYGLVAGTPFLKVEPVDEAAEMRRIEAQAQARRFGSIVFLTSERMCEEHRFDNSNGYTVAINYVDCEARMGISIEAMAQAAPVRPSALFKFNK
ncbi:MAG TPA: hypothetical protein VGC36_10230 [Rhizomicrobium sp.]